MDTLELTDRGRWAAGRFALIAAVVGWIVALVLAGVLIARNASADDRSVTIGDSFTGVVGAMSSSGRSVCVRRDGHPKDPDDCALPIIDPDHPVQIGDEVTVTEVWLGLPGDRGNAYYLQPR